MAYCKTSSCWYGYYAVNFICAIDKTRKIKIDNCLEFHKHSYNFIKNMTNYILLRRTADLGFCVLVRQYASLRFLFRYESRQHDKI